VPAERLNIHWRYRLTVDGAAPAGLTNPSWVLMDGAGNGHAGSNYVTSITWRNLAGRASKLPTRGLIHAAGPRAAAKVQATPHLVQATLHKAAVDHLLATTALHVPVRRPKH
jgi:hypothetical protein